MNAYDNQMNLQKRMDMMMTYRCDGTWEILGKPSFKNNFTIYNQSQLEDMTVDPNTCKLNNTKYPLNSDEFNAKV
jgi:hypothetical protein